MIAETQTPLADNAHDARLDLGSTFSPDGAGEQVEIKIAYIGGGSREWAIKLMGDLALGGRLTGRLALYDIDVPAALHNERLSREIFCHRQSRSRFEVKAEARLEDALRGADFVVVSIEPGSTALRRADLEIPAKYGILQTVGDTTGPGGVLRALRCIPLFRQFARAIMQHCPQAWVINYTNPMAVCTAALFAEAPGIKAMGCCHEVFGTQKMLASLVADWFQVPRPPREEVRLDIAGVNHFTWATRISWRGHDLLPRLSEMAGDEETYRKGQVGAEWALQNDAWFAGDGLVACDLLRRFGAFGAAGDRHLAEFFPWYLSSEEELHRWGVIRTPYRWRLERSKKPAAALGSYDRGELLPSGEEGVQIMEALVGLRALITNVNLPNAGQIADLPRRAVVETYACVRQNEICPLIAGRLPEAAAGFVRRALDEQALTLEAGMTKNRGSALEALMVHPLVQMPYHRVEQMFDEMIEATREMLPGWEPRV